MARKVKRQSKPLAYEIVTIDFNRERQRVEPVEPGKMTEQEIVALNTKIAAKRSLLRVRE